MRRIIISTLAAFVTSALAVESPVEVPKVIQLTKLSVTQVAAIRRVSGAVLQARGQNPSIDIQSSRQQLVQLQSAIADALRVDTGHNSLAQQQSADNAEPGDKARFEVGKSRIRRMLNNKSLRGLGAGENLVEAEAGNNAQEATLTQVENDAKAALDDEKQGYSRLKALSGRLSPKRLMEVANGAGNTAPAPTFITIIRHR